jgi:hypothetical protein
VDEITNNITENNSPTRLSQNEDLPRAGQVSVKITSKKDK